MNSLLLIVLFLFSTFSLFSQPPGAVPARPNMIYYAGGSCEFYDASNVKLLSVDQNEAVWSVSPAKAAWVLVTPANGGYYEFPSYSNVYLPTYDHRDYLLPFWKSDTIFDELVLLDKVNAEATLMYTPKSIISVRNFDGTVTFEQNKDYSLTNRTIKQLSGEMSKTVSIVPGKTGNGNSNGLVNTRHTSWTRVTYVADRAIDPIAIDIEHKKSLLPKTMTALSKGNALIIQAVGMSITAGLNVTGFIGDDKNFPPTKPYMRGYVELFAEQLKQQYGSAITSINSACGGKTIGWLDTYAGALVNRNTPDLVIIDMGMNDIWGATSQTQFKSKMQNIITTIRKDVPNAEFILISNMIPDVKGVGAPANGAVLMFGFLEALQSLEGPGIAVLDMTSLSETIYQRKGAKHCIANSLHPNDYLARWYAQGLMAIFGDGVSVPKQPRTFYVNKNGDNSDGLSIEKGWTSLDKINDMTFIPGDTILFEGGSTLSGAIELQSNDGNDPSKPIVFTTYGQGRVTIQTTNNKQIGCKVVNGQGIEFHNMIFKGMGGGVQRDADGMFFYSDKPSGKLRNIQINNVEVSDFGYCGIRFYSEWSKDVQSGYKDVLINNCKIHDCKENGIVSFAYDTQSTDFYHHSRFTIRNSEVYNISGYDAPTHKGSGIVLSQIDSSIIEYSRAYNNGTENTACGGPGGIWVYAADNVIIQFCESHNNSSGKGKGCDGLGFDLDGGVTNSIIQYCYSHDNDGAGYLFGNFDGSRPWGKNLMRYSISVNDARTNNSSVTMFTAPNTGWDGFVMHNNTIITSPAPKNAYPSFAAVQLTEYGSVMSNIRAYNNAIITDGVKLLDVPPSFVNQKPHFKGNGYWANGKSFLMRYGKEISSLQAFRAECPDCEKLGNLDVGVYADPQIHGFGKAAPINFPLANADLEFYRIAFNSAFSNVGIDVQKEFGLNLGERDFYGKFTTEMSKHSIGAHAPSMSPSNVLEEISESIIISQNSNGGVLIDVRTPFSSIAVFSLLGEKLFEKANVNSSLSDNKFELLMRPGTYFLIVKYEKHSHAIPFTIQW